MTPVGSAAQNPQTAVDESPVICSRSASISGFAGQQVLDLLPLCFRELVSPRCVLRGLAVKRGHPNPRRKEPRMAHGQHTPTLASLEEAITVLFCLVDDTYTLLNPDGRSHESLKRLSDSEVLTLALFQQLRSIESERSFLREAQRFFSHLFPGVVGMHPSSLHRRVRKLRRFLEPLRRE